jgi:hypothetical protein
VSASTCQRASHRPPAIDAREYCALGNSRYFRPFGNASCLPLMGQDVVVGFVAHLLDRCCPSAVARLVSDVVVDAIDRRAGRGRPHISDESLVRAPALAYGNATPSVVREGWVVGVGAPGEHLRPRNMRLVSRLSSSGAVSDAGNFPVAPTTHCPARTKVGRGYKRGIAAFASAFPNNVAANDFVRQCDDGEASYDVSESVRDGASHG